MRWFGRPREADNPGGVGSPRRAADAQPRLSRVAVPSIESSPASGTPGQTGRTVTSCRWTADNHHVSTDAQTQAIARFPAAAMPGVSAAVIAASDAETAAPAPDAETAAPGRDTELAAPQPAADNAASAPDAEVAAAGSDAEVDGEEPVQQVYEAAMARLNALHVSWAAAMVELRESQVDSGGVAAA